jgi:hypothetical protein
MRGDENYGTELGGDRRGDCRGGTMLVALGGIFFVLRQIKQVERTIRGTTHERLTAESFDLLRFLASAPHTYSYFYEEKPLGPND